MHWSYRTNAISFWVLTAAALVLAAGFLPGDPGWAAALAGASLLFGAFGALLWRGANWAAPVGIGLAGFAVGVWIQSTFALAILAPATAAARTSLTTCAVGLALSTIASGLLWAIPREVSWRHGASIAFAGAALFPSVLFALAPAQDLAVSLAMGVGSLGLVAGTVAVGRGRTWGLLANLVGALIIGVGVAFAPSLGHLDTGNPWLPNGGSLLLDVLGICAATLAGLSTLIFAGPVVRFLLGTSPSSTDAR
jgi:hypothetical protein